MPTMFPDRYLYARYEEGGVVVDLASGNYYRVNRSAIAICAALHAEKDQPAAEARVARELALSATDAAQAVHDVIAALDRPTFHGEVQGSYHLHPTDDGYELRHDEARVLDVARDGSRISVATGGRTSSVARLELYARAVLPKLLPRHGVTILHAAACSIDGRIVAFSGISGAGKTTTARAFAEVGAPLVSEEWIALAPGRPSAEVLVRAESAISEWAKETARRLMRDHECLVSPPAFAESLVGGPTAPLTRILFLDRGRRRGDQFQVKPLAPPDALAELLRHDFLGAAETDAWRRFFGAAVDLLAQIEAQEAWAPEDVALLKDAAARYVSSTAS